MQTAAAVKIKESAPVALQASVDNFVNVPAITLPAGFELPNGHTLKAEFHVPSFKVAQYSASKSETGTVIIDASLKPWNRISYYDAMKATAEAGYEPLKLSQSLSIAYQIALLDINWTGGKVGEGDIFKGIHKGNVDEAQAGDFVSEDAEERTWHELPNGEKIYHYSGNIYEWILDDLHGDENGVINQRFEDDDIMLTLSPYPSMEKGTGWRPDGGRDWSGRALLRGGFWYSGGRAGVFYLGYGWPGSDYNGGVGFRCTKNL